MIWDVFFLLAFIGIITAYDMKLRRYICECAKQKQQLNASLNLLRAFMRVIALAEVEGPQILSMTDEQRERAHRVYHYVKTGEKMTENME